MTSTTFRKGAWGVLVASLAVLVIACGGPSSSTTEQGSSSSGGYGGGAAAPAQSAAPAAPATPAAAPVVATATATVNGASKTILTDSTGRTLYFFKKDQGGKVTCVGGCAQAWPPVLLPAGTATATSASQLPGTLATVANPAGGTQVTYNTWPLYRFASDQKPGDTLGAGIPNWAIATPDTTANG